ncbi:hypothetical protein MJO28_011507 [Puccinia striiformis f. sp. tritici]|uniref:Uncharacterized protein n=1 Tax=Puccinia striiformis f. sp. tritici TaxID=168172 RepID=A0ACC0E299_9BASI|nr:hypothetical protein MJO28_011507 [Puccinia striiformis f. sp. tritici]
MPPNESETIYAVSTSSAQLAMPGTRRRISMPSPHPAAAGQQTGDPSHRDKCHHGSDRLTL